MIKIEQIATTGDDFSAAILVLGLGDDSKVYYWDVVKAEWKLYKKEIDTNVPF